MEISSRKQIFIILVILCVCQYNIKFTSGQRNGHRNSAQSRRQSFPDYGYNLINSQFFANSILKLGKDVVNKISQSEAYFPTAHVISPTSIAGALLLTMLGSSGETFKEFSNIFLGEHSYYIQNNSIDFHKELALLYYDLLTNEQASLLTRPAEPWRIGGLLEDSYDFYGRKPENVNDKSEHTIEIANGVFVHEEYPLRSSYKRAVKKGYHGEIQPLNFRQGKEAARRYINDWVRLRTHDRIPEILSDSISDDENVIIASALYFKGLWETYAPYHPQKSLPFYRDGIDNPPIQAVMMATTATVPYYNSVEDDCQILGIPYKGNLTTMYVIIPNRSSRQRLWEFKDQLTAYRINQLIEKMELKAVTFTLPKLDLRTSYELGPVFAQLGLRSVFSRRTSDLSLIADEFNNGNVEEGEQNHNNGGIFPSDSVLELDRLRLSRQYRNPGLFANEIIHKVDLTVNDKGTEGGAATLVRILKSGPEIILRVEFPFMFIVRHDPTRMPLFYGLVYEPVADSL